MQEELLKLWENVHDLDRKFSGNNLAPIMGNGKTENPKFMFVFINPTSRNTSSNPKWQGPRFPFIGTKQIWRIFYHAGIFNSNLMQEIESGSIWDIEFTIKVLDFLKSMDFYFTNLVKWTGKDATLPNSEKINRFLPILINEIEIVKPKYVVTFGLIPFQSLTKSTIKLGSYYSETMKAKKLKIYETRIGKTAVKIIPCYFPIGRGNPKRAVDILKLLQKLN